MRNYLSKEVKRIVNKYAKMDSFADMFFHAKSDSKVTASPYYELLAFLYAAKGGEDSNVISILQENSSYKEGKLNPDEEEILIQNYKDAVEYICDNSENRNINSPISTQPKELTSYIASFFNPEDGKTENIVYNPFAMLGSYPVSVKCAHFVGEEENPVRWAIAMVRLHANNVQAEIRCTSPRDSLKDQSIRHKYIVATIPLKISDYPVEEIVNDLYSKLDNGGAMVIVVPSAFLVDEQALAVRNNIVKEGALRSVFLLPQGIFVMPNNMYSGGYENGSAVLLISKGTEDLMYEDSDSESVGNILMADASFATRNDLNIKGVRFDYEAFEFAAENQEPGLYAANTSTLMKSFRKAILIQNFSFKALWKRIRMALSLRR